MPVSNTVFLNNAAYSSASYTTGWLNYESTSYFTFTAYCNAGVDLTLDYAVDSSYQILETETIPVDAATTVTLTRAIKTSYIRFSVINITPPVDLKLQGFFFTNGISISTPRFMRQLSINASFAVSGSATRIYGYFNDCIGDLYEPGFFSTTNSYLYHYIIPADGVINNFYIRLQNPPLSANTMTYTIYVNEVATSMAIIMTGGNSFGSNMTPLNVNGGDRVYCRYAQVGTVPNPDTTISCLYTAN